MAERAPVSTEETLVRYDNPVLVVTKRAEKVSSGIAGSSVQPCVPTEAKKETEEILNAILPPKEWEEDGQIWTQKVTINCGERGLLLLRVRDEARITMEAYQTLYCSSIAFGMRKALQSEQGKSDLMDQVAKLESERSALEKQCMELKQKTEQLERRAAELRAAEEKRHQEELNWKAS
ncbi:hypothetical protein HF086_002103 [Spodoptera exigua]|uniref:Uncharacterized protein n=1 Tax=Spodoptera exigua TaxID=7107 RepID=A0A922MN51_SPOEX|nr:hypothetical protein HF086_002103 [Spodoptera exigua]